MRFVRHPWPYNQTVQAVTLSLQNKTGKDAGHWASTGGYDDVDGLFQSARPLMTVGVGLGRIVTLHDRTSTSHQIHYYIRCYL
jgi:hypothetical protein